MEEALDVRVLHWPLQSLTARFSKVVPAGQLYFAKNSTVAAEVGAAMNTKNARAEAASLLFLLETMTGRWVVSEIVSTTTDVAIVVHTFQVVGIERVVFVNEIEVSGLVIS